MIEPVQRIRISGILGPLQPEIVDVAAGLTSADRANQDNRKRRIGIANVGSNPIGYQNICS